MCQVIIMLAQEADRQEAKGRVLNPGEQRQLLASMAAKGKQ